MSRVDIIKALADAIGGEPCVQKVEAFMKDVAVNKKRKLEETGFDKLADILLDNMDKEDQADYKELKDEIAKKKNLEKLRSGSSGKRRLPPHD